MRKLGTKMFSGTRPGYGIGGILKAGAKKAAMELGGSKDDAEAEKDLKKGAARTAMKTRGACVKDMEAQGDDATACDDDAKATYKETVDGDDADFNNAIMAEAKIPTVDLYAAIMRTNPH